MCIQQCIHLKESNHFFTSSNYKLWSHASIPIQLSYTNLRPFPIAMFPPYTSSPPIHQTRSLRSCWRHCLSRCIFWNFAFLWWGWIASTISVACCAVCRICVVCRVVFTVDIYCIRDKCAATVSTIDISLLKPVELQLLVDHVDKFNHGCVCVGCGAWSGWVRLWSWEDLVVRQNEGEEKRESE